jgi:hypothetical protein
MQAYFVVLKASRYAVTGESGQFRLPELPARRYTITAWHEAYGSQKREISLADGETQTLDFVFKSTP